MMSEVVIPRDEENTNTMSRAKLQCTRMGTPATFAMVTEPLMTSSSGRLYSQACHSSRRVCCERRAGRPGGRAARDRVSASPTAGRGPARLDEGRVERVPLRAEPGSVALGEPQRG